MSASSADDGFEPLVRYRLLSRMAGINVLTTTIVSAACVVFCASLGGDLFDTDDSFGWRHWIGFIVGAVVGVALDVAVIELIGRIRFPQPFVDLDRGLLRAGRRTVPLASITRAELIVDQRRGAAKRIGIVFGGGDTPRVTLPLRDASGATSSEAVRERVAAALRQTSITMPTDRRDPQGRFARQNFPTRIGKDDAVAVVLDPPRHGDPLPIPEPPGTRTGRHGRMGG